MTQPKQIYFQLLILRKTLYKDFYIFDSHFQITVIFMRCWFIIIATKPHRPIYNVLPTILFRLKIAGPTESMEWRHRYQEIRRLGWMVKDEIMSILKDVILISYFEQRTEDEFTI